MFLKLSMVPPQVCWMEEEEGGGAIRFLFTVVAKQAVEFPISFITLRSDTSDKGHSERRQTSKQRTSLKYSKVLMYTHSIENHNLSTEENS